MNRFVSTPRLVTLILLVGGQVFMTAANAADGVPAAACDDPLLVTGFDRSVKLGSQEALLGAVQRGEPIRVGWEMDLDGNGVTDLAHWSDAEFLTVIGGHAATQVRAIHRQFPDLEAGTVELSDAFDRWHGLLDSRGTLTGRFEGSEDVHAFPVRLTWCRNTPRAPGWRLVYRHDSDGRPLFGTLEHLVDAVRAGQAVQVGWGLSYERDGQPHSIEHLVQPDFVTVIDGRHVVAQMPEHVAQQGYATPESARFEDGAVMWRGLASTEGRFEAIWTHRGSGEEVRRIPQRAAFAWFVMGLPVKETPPLAIQGGVRLEATTEEE